MTNQMHTIPASQPCGPAFVIDPAQDPRDVFLKAEEVHAYLGRGRSQGYQITSQPGFKALAILPGRWRLADVRAYFDMRAELVLQAELANLRERPSESLADTTEADVEDNYPYLHPRRRSAGPGAKEGRAS